MTGPAFRLPALPAGWFGADLVRLVDPTGSAIAWIAPGTGAACVAYFVCDDDGTWREVLGRSEDAQGAAGITIDGRAPAWRLASRDPTACRLEREGAFGRLTAWLDDARLWLELHVGVGKDVSIDFGGPAPIQIEGEAEDVVIEAGAVSTMVGGVFRVRVG